VRWVGPLYDDDKWQAFSAAELFVLPSHQENFGIVVAVALAVGTPDCTTTGVNTHGIETRYKAGLVCNDEEAALNKTLARGLALSAGEMEILSRNARRCYEEQFQVSTASGRLLSALETAVANARLAMGVVNYSNAERRASVEGS
jgi:glycosyltransferase involved in cell wall biosynthesis